MLQQPLFDYSAIVLCNKGLYSVSNKSNDIKIGQLLCKLWQIHSQLLNLRIFYIVDPSRLFQLLAQYLGSDKRRVLTPGVTYGLCDIKLHWSKCIQYMCFINNCCGVQRVIA